MSKFEFMDFWEGSAYPSEKVFHANKYTKEEALEIFNTENKYMYSGRYAGMYRRPIAEDIKTGFARFYVKTPENIGEKFEDGCYAYCEEGVRGSFPVLVITNKDLLIEGVEQDERD